MSHNTDPRYYTVLWRRTMKRFIAGTVTGCVLASGLFLLLYLPNAASERQLVESWREIQPEMPIAEIKARLGEPAYEFEIGTGFPPYAGAVCPKGYSEDHSLYVFTIRTFAPKLLLVFVSVSGEVSFVSSVST